MTSLKEMHAVHQSDYVAPVNPDALDVELIPGTEIFTDLGTTRFVHGSNNVVLVPQPHDDIHDPLNWSPMWKYIVLVNTSFYMFLGNFSGLSIGPMTPAFIEYFDIGLTKVALLTGACILAFGYANLAIIPCVNVFGRRPTALGCSVVCIVACIWAAVSKSYNSLLGARVLIGLGAATAESFMPVVVADVVFLHQRGLWNTIYFCVFFGGAFVGPIVSGVIVDAVSWRWFFWLATILQGVNFLLLFFLFPETKYSRNSTLQEMSSAPYSTPSTRHNPGQLPYEEGAVAHESKLEQSSSHQAMPTQVSLLGKGYPSRAQRWTVFVKPDLNEVPLLLRHILTPFQVIWFPVILYGALCVAMPACALIVISLTYSPVFSVPPFNFSPLAVGMVNFALLGGGIFGLLTAGPLSDWISMRLTEKNKGIREPEMRLWSLIPFCVIGAIGMIISALGQQNIWPWPVTVIIGYGFVAVHVVAIPAIGITYSIDSYTPIAGQILVVATVVKNTFAYGMTYYINDWAARSGYIPPYMTLMALSVGLPLLGIPVFHRFGKTFRKITRNSKVHQF